MKERGWKIVNMCSAVIYGVQTKETMMEEAKNLNPILILESSSMTGLGLFVGYRFQPRAALQGLIFLIFWALPTFLDPLIWNIMYLGWSPLPYQILIWPSFIINSWLAALLVVSIMLGKTVPKWRKRNE